MGKILFYVSSLDDLNDYERKHNAASYKRIADAYAANRILCNNIAEADPTIWENVENYYSDDEEDNEIFQYYLCNLSEYEEEKLLQYGFIISYSELLDTNVIMVDHFGTSWDYVLTNTEITTDFQKALKED